jgi:hypothetical protein
MTNKLFCKLACWLSGHDWTCAAKEGTRATEEQLQRGVAGFVDYAKMYCKRCGKESGTHHDVN